MLYWLYEEHMDTSACLFLLDRTQLLAFHQKHQIVTPASTECVCHIAFGTLSQQFASLPAVKCRKWPCKYLYALWKCVICTVCSVYDKWELAMFSYLWTYQYVDLMACRHRWHMAIYHMWNMVIWVPHGHTCSLET